MLVCILYAHFSYSQSKSFTSYEEKIPGSDQTIKMVPIKKGSFLMGSPSNEKGRNADEGPQHKVQVDAFWMAEVEITWDLYHLFMLREIDAAQKKGVAGKEVNIDVNAVSGATTPYVEMSFGMGTEGFPAINMTQYAASKFCEWLSAMTGNYYRLPTEAEWEYACRAGSTTAYSFGKTFDRIEEYAWFIDNSKSGYHKVGQLEPNAWGLYDMHGNVAEWTLDLYTEQGYESSSAQVNPFKKPSKTYPRVVRGGSWMDGPEALRSAARLGSDKQWKMKDPQIPKSKWWHTDAPFVGFRIVRPFNTPDPSTQQEYWKEKH